MPSWLWQSSRRTTTVSSISDQPARGATHSAVSREGSCDYGYRATLQSPYSSSVVSNNIELHQGHGGAGQQETRCQERLCAKRRNKFRKCEPGFPSQEAQVSQAPEAGAGRGEVKRGFKCIGLISSLLFLRVLELIFVEGTTCLSMSPPPTPRMVASNFVWGKCIIVVAWAWVSIQDIVLVLAKILSTCMKGLVFLRRCLFGSGAQVCFEMC